MRSRSALSLTILGLAGTFLLLQAMLFGQLDRIATARSYLQQGRIEEARKILLEQLRETPNHQVLHAMLGQIAFSRLEFQQAVEHFRKADNVIGSNPLMRINLAEALLETHAVDLAKLELAKLASTSTIAQFEAGLLLARHGDFLAAEQHFLKAKPLYPKPQVISYNLALTQYSARKFPECSATLEEATRKGIRSADILNLLGQSYSESGRTVDAAKILKEAVRLYPKDERNYVSLATILIEDDRAAEGLEIVDKGLGLLPRSPAILLQRAYLLMSLGRNGEAELDYHRVVDIDKKSVAARIGLAFSLIQRQRQTEATTLLEELASSDRGTYFPYYLLGELYLRQGLEDQAILSLTRAASLEPAFAAVHSSLGKLHLKKQNLGAAVKELEMATRLDPSDTTGFYQLSIAYRKMGQPERAREALIQVRRLNEIERELGTSRFLTRKLKSLRDNFNTSPN
jgi:predicted Zn-dependent protease